MPAIDCKVSGGVMVFSVLAQLLGLLLDLGTLLLRGSVGR